MNFWLGRNSNRDSDRQIESKCLRQLRNKNSRKSRWIRKGPVMQSLTIQILTIFEVSEDVKVLIIFDQFNINLIIWIRLRKISGQGWANSKSNGTSFRKSSLWYYKDEDQAINNGPFGRFISEFSTYLRHGVWYRTITTEMIFLAEFEMY